MDRDVGETEGAETRRFAPRKWEKRAACESRLNEAAPPEPTAERGRASERLGGTGWAPPPRAGAPFREAWRPRPAPGGPCSQLLHEARWSEEEHVAWPFGPGAAGGTSGLGSRWRREAGQWPAGGQAARGSAGTRPSSVTPTAVVPFRGREEAQGGGRGDGGDGSLSPRGSQHEVPHVARGPSGHRLARVGDSGKQRVTTKRPSDGIMGPSERPHPVCPQHRDPTQGKGVELEISTKTEKSPRSSLRPQPRERCPVLGSGGWAGGCLGHSRVRRAVKATRAEGTGPGSGSPAEGALCLREQGRPRPGGGAGLLQTRGGRSHAGPRAGARRQPSSPWALPQPQGRTAVPLPRADPRDS